MSPFYCGWIVNGMSYSPLLKTTPTFPVAIAVTVPVQTLKLNVVDPCVRGRIRKDPLVGVGS